jgi:hypothetical protein
MLQATRKRRFHMPKKDLRQMKNEKNRISKEDVRETAQKLNMDVSGIEDESVKGLEDTIAQYENKSEGELMGDLERMISQGRKDGSFTDDMLEGFIQNVAPMLDAEQRKKIESIAQMIKMNKI